MRQTDAETHGEKRDQFGKGVLELFRIPGVQRDQKRRVRGSVDVSRYHVITFILRDNVIFKLTSPPRPLLPSPAPPVTAVTRLPVPHRLQPPRFRHPHRADGQHRAGGGDGERGDSSP